MRSSKSSINERYEYQQYIIKQLEKDGYIERDSKHFDKYSAMDPDLLLKFLTQTQPKVMSELKKMYGADLKTFIVNSINKAATDKNNSILNLLKNGVYVDNNPNHKLKLLYNKPATDYNPDLIKKYKANIFSVMQEVWVDKDNKERVDLVIFINGIAIISIELKSNTQGQNFKDAIKQYKKERNPKDRIFLFKAGCLVNFAMDLEQVYMTTKLDKDKTYFIPFNRGKGHGVDSGAGNPIDKDGFGVRYMWEDILTKDTLLELIEKFIFIQKKEDKDSSSNYSKRKYKEQIIFPRYHQLDVIRKILADLKINHTSQNYLIEHSAGSGKTNTIAWLASRLVSLHDDENNNIFDNIIVMTDRVVVDRQLQNAILRLKEAAGVVKVMDDKCTSADLAAALSSNTKIVVTTIQKFPYVLDIIKDNGSNGPILKGKKFAVIIDEAHSSTAGKNMLAVSQTLSASGESDEDIQDILTNQIQKSGKQPNVSMFAFTATPKETTLRLFGRPDKNGDYVAFHLYGMKQAIEEGFILDVLANYTTYKTIYKLNKNIVDDPTIPANDAKRQIARYIDLHDDNITQRTKIIIEHFIQNVQKELINKNTNMSEAKAMVVTASRQAAVKYKQAFDKYIREHRINNIKTLVAFSGTVTVDGHDYTEASINGFSEENTAKEFDQTTYQILIVANKYQVGFDQPKLVAMYIMKKLHGVNAVQTLSRLNRVYYPYKKVPVVIDFVNDYKDIEKDFRPFYTTTILANTINPQTIYRLNEKIDGYYILDPLDIDNANQILLKKQKDFRDKQHLTFYGQKVQSALTKGNLSVNDQKDFVKLLRHFCRYYEFLLQISMLEDLELQKKYNFIVYVLNYIDVRNDDVSYDLTGKLSATDFIQENTGHYEVKHKISDPIVKLPVVDDTSFTEPTKKRLSEIIEEINSKTGANFDKDVVTKSLMQVKDIMLKNQDLKESAKNNSATDFELAYNEKTDDALIKGISQNKTFFTYLLNTPEVKKEVLGIFATEVYKALKES